MGHGAKRTFKAGGAYIYEPVLKQALKIMKKVLLVLL